MSSVVVACRVFKMKRWVSYCYWICCFISCLLPIGVIVALSSDDAARFSHATELGLASILILLSTGIAALTFRFAPRATGRRIEIDSDEIREVGLCRTKSLPFTEVRGFESVRLQHSKYFRLCAKTASHPNIKILQQYERYAELVEWMKANFTDLDAARYNEELSEISKNEELGSIPEERASAYQLARKVCRVANGAGFLVMMWGLIYPRPFHVVAWTLIALPFVAFLIRRRFAGAVKLDGTSMNAYGNVALLWLMPPAVLSIHALEMNAFDFEHFWMPFALLTGGFGALMAWVGPEIRQPSRKLIVYAIFWPIFGYAATLTLNAVCATSRPMVYRVEVMAKHASGGQHVSFYLTLSPWYTLRKEKELMVPWSVYKKYSVGQSATVLTCVGAFGIPFCSVE